MSKAIPAKLSLGVLVCLFLFSLIDSQARAVDEVPLSEGQAVYVPVYSNVFTAPKKIPFQLATILSIRNTDPKNSILVTAADYFSTKGSLIRKYLEKDQTLGPLESTYIYIPEGDDKGGFGANFIVKWTAVKAVNIPIIECVMIGAKSGQGISFVSPGQVIREDTR
jgi:hypothetical protein